MHKNFLALLVVLSTACGGDSTGPSDSTPSLAGGWNIQANISNSAAALTCIATGDLSLTQQGAQFSGSTTNSTGTCSGPGGTAAFDANGPISGGQISGSQVSFTDGVCSYTGNATGSPVNLVKGDVSCNFPVQGQNLPMNGTWQNGPLGKSHNNSHSDSQFEDSEARQQLSRGRASLPLLGSNQDSPDPEWPQ
jgi:hypothetical protein